jgi:hypothetical protein
MAEVAGLAPVVPSVDWKSQTIAPPTTEQS